MRINNVVFFAILLIFLIAALEYTVNPFNWFVYGLRNLVTIMLLIFLFRRGSFNKGEIFFFSLYLFSFFTGLVLALPYSLANVGWVTQDYRVFLGRVFNLLSLSLFSIVVCNYFLSNKEKVIFILKGYYFSILILLLSVVYHFLTFKFGFLPFPFETRSNLHSYSDRVDEISRATGLAREPSFLANYATEFLILSLFVLRKQYKVISVCFFILVVSITFSPSLILGLLLSLGLYFILSIKFYDFKKIFILVASVLSLVLSLTIYLRYVDSLIYNYIFYRVENAGESGRFISIFNAIDIMFNHSTWYNFLFGYGLGVYRLLDNSSLSNLYYSNFTQTSNNVFIDVFFECGLVGFIILLLFFIYVFRIILISKQDLTQKKLAMWLFSSLIIGSCYRGDFSSLHFFIILIFIFLLTKVDVFFKRDFL